MDTGSTKGRGVYANRTFQEGETVEESLVVLFQIPFSELPESIENYVFNWGKLADTEESSALALGFGSMYNHNDPANMRYEADPARQTLRFIAVQAIAKGEELTINYNAIGGGSIWRDNNWFERMDVAPITTHEDQDDGSVGE